MDNRHTGLFLGGGRKPCNWEETHRENKHTVTQAQDPWNCEVASLPIVPSASKTVSNGFIFILNSLECKMH